MASAPLSMMSANQNAVTSMIKRSHFWVKTIILLYQK